MHRLIVPAISAAVGLGIVACGPPMRGNPDPFSAVEDRDVGLPVLGLQWQHVVADNARERKPQEFASGAIYRDRLVLGSHAGIFYSLFRRDGSMQWKVDLGSVSSRPVADRGSIYVGTDDGAMVALDTFDGRTRWRYSTRGAILQPGVLSGELLFFSNEADQVYALDQQTGKYRWQHKSETPEEFTIRGHSGVAVSDNLVFTGFSNGTMVALRVATGSVAWMTSLKGDGERFLDVDGTPVIAGSTVYVTSSAGGVYALDKTTGLVRWHLPVKNAGGLTIDGSRIYVAAAESGIYALDLDGHIVWRQGTHGGGEPAAPLVTGDYLIYTLADAGLFIVDKRTGRLHQYFDPGNGVSSRPTVRGDNMYVLSNGGILYAMRLARF